MVFTEENKAFIKILYRYGLRKLINEFPPGKG